MTMQIKRLEIIVPHKEHSSEAVANYHKPFSSIRTYILVCKEFMQTSKNYRRFYGELD